MNKTIEPFFCDTGHLEGEDYICDKHGYMWEDTRPFCNAISDDLIELIWYTGSLENELRFIANATARYQNVT